MAFVLSWTSNNPFWLLSRKNLSIFIVPWHVCLGGTSINYSDGNKYNKGGSPVRFWTLSDYFRKIVWELFEKKNKVMAKLGSGRGRARFLHGSCNSIGSFWPRPKQVIKNVQKIGAFFIISYNILGNFKNFHEQWNLKLTRVCLRRLR